MKTPQILIDAQNHWPEDEALLQAQSFAGNKEDYPDEVADNVMRLRMSCYRMERFFREESDGEQLVARFRAAVQKLTGVDVSADPTFLGDYRTVIFSTRIDHPSNDLSKLTPEQLAARYPISN